MFKKILSLGFFAFLAIALLAPVQSHAAQNLGDVFNFFDVKCLVPDSSTIINAGADGLSFKHRACKNGGASLLDQAVNFLLQLGPTLAVIVVIWGGFLYYNSVFDGDDARATKTVRAGVTGLAIILAVPIIYGIFQDLSASGSTSQSLFKTLTQILVGQIIRPLANTGIVLGAAAAVLSFVFAGYQYLLNDPKKGQTALQNAFIGLIVVLASVAIVALIQATYNFIF
jgi:Type IV secretion system pilin